MLLLILTSWWISSQAMACDFHLFPLNKQIQSFPLEPQQTLSLPGYWEHFLTDLMRVDLNSPEPVLELTHVVWIEGINQRGLQKLFQPEHHPISKYLIDGWKNLGLIQDGHFRLIPHEEIIKHFNQISTMVAIRDAERPSDSALGYAKQIINGKIYLIDIHDLILHLPLFSTPQSQKYLDLFVKDLYLTETTFNSALNSIFENGTNFNDGVFVGPLVGVKNAFTSPTPTTKIFYETAQFHMEQIQSGESNDLILNFDSIKSSESAMWFSGLVTVYLKQLSLYTRSQYFSAQNRAGLKDHDMTLEVLQKSYQAIQEFPEPLEIELQKLQSEIKELQNHLF